MFFFLKEEEEENIYIYIYKDLPSAERIYSEFIPDQIPGSHLSRQMKGPVYSEVSKIQVTKTIQTAFFLPEHQRNKHFNFSLFFSVIKWTLCVNKPGAEGYFWLSVSLARTVTGGDKPAVRFWRFDQRFVLLSLCLLLTNLYFFTEITPNTPTHPNSN